MPVLTDLTVKPAAVASPMDEYSKALTLQSLMTENSLRNQQIQQSQQQTQDLQAQAQQRQRDLSDQSTFQKALLDNKGDWDKTFQDTTGQISPVNQLALQKAHTEDVKNKSAAGSDQLKLENEQYGKIDNWLQGIKSDTLPDDQKAVEYQNGLNRFSADPQIAPLIQKGKQIGLIPNSYDPDSIDKLHTFVVGHAGTLKEAQTLQETNTSKASQKKSEQDTLNLQAQLPGEQAKSAEAQANLPLVQALDAAQFKDPDLLKPEERIRQQLAERQQATAAGRLAVSQQQLDLNKTKQAAEIGPETAQTWVDTLKKNPDAEKEVPPILRSKVATMFSQQTGLPMPSAASATSQSTELAGRNALDNATFINKAIQNPEIQKRLGPILGRLGTFEQNLGTATAGLSPADAKIAQELRTRMRYFVFQEGKSVLGGRLPQNLMKQLEESSANVHMDTPTLQGAIDGAVGAAQTNMDNVDKERFGGQARPRLLRGLDPGEVRILNGKRIGSDDGGKTIYDADTGDRINP